MSILVALGDSTTAVRGDMTIYADILRLEFSSNGLEVINAGVPGNTTEAARERFERDVINRHPDIAVIQFGINDAAIDVWKSPEPATKPRVSLSNFEINIDYFVNTLQERDCAVILMTPNPTRWTAELKQLYGKNPYRVDDTDGFNVILCNYVESIRKIAAVKRLAIIDVYDAFQAYGQVADKSVDDLLLDGMHPNAKGHRLVADLLLPEVRRLALA
jgi:lysophospholipase L1-like esterase